MTFKLRISPKWNKCQLCGGVVLHKICAPFKFHGTYCMYTTHPVHLCQICVINIYCMRQQYSGVIYTPGSLFWVNLLVSDLCDQGYMLPAEDRILPVEVAAAFPIIIWYDKVQMYIKLTIITDMAQVPKGQVDSKKRY